MKKIILFIVLLFTISIGISAQETTYPRQGQEIVRRVTTIDLEGKYYDNVVITLKSNTPDYIITSKNKVKVTIQDSEGKKIYKKTFKNAYLYIFSSGDVYVGIPNFNQVIIWKNKSENVYYAKIREKEGVYL